jgi:hypothetical protein
VYLGAPPELFVASARLIAAAGTRAQASFIAAMTERSEQVVLYALHQILPQLARQRAPLFARPAAGIFAFGHDASFALVFVCGRNAAYSLFPLRGERVG